MSCDVASGSKDPVEGLDDYASDPEEQVNAYKKASVHAAQAAITQYTTPIINPLKPIMPPYS